MALNPTTALALQIGDEFVAAHPEIEKDQDRKYHARKAAALLFNGLVRDTTAGMKPAESFLEAQTEAQAAKIDYCELDAFVRGRTPYPYSHTPSPGCDD
jgi:hypothetical protein